MGSARLSRGTSFSGELGSEDEEAPGMATVRRPRREAAVWSAGELEWEGGPSAAAGTIS